MASRGSDSADATLLQWGHGKPRGDELGGGLNNMLMNMAQLINDACPGGKRPTATLVLPNLTAGWRFFKPGEAGRRITRPLLFGEVFDAPFFIESIRPCVAIEISALGAHRRRSAKATLVPANIEPINAKYRYGHLLPLVYRGLRPSAAVGAVVASHVRHAVERAGPRWAAVHLRIERDWWMQSGFCRTRKYPVQRCYAPDEVATLTAASRAAANATGTVLVYAADNVHPSGPRVRRSAFGPATTNLPAAPLRTAYTLRAAAELFAAAAAPGGFYGNSFSTFSRGAALLRAAAANRAPPRRWLGLSGGEKGALAAMGVAASSLHGAKHAAEAADAGGASGGGASYAYDCARELATDKERRAMPLGVQLLTPVDRARCVKEAGGKGGFLAGRSWG